MKTFGLPVLSYLLLGMRESYSWTISSTSRSWKRNTDLKCKSSGSQLGLRRSLLYQAGLVAFNLVVGVQPTFGAGTMSTVETGAPASKNKKLGGLAFKIQSVGHVMVCCILLVVASLGLLYFLRILSND
jgi:hypothetical protein